MRVLVCGGRDYDDWDELSEELTYLLGDHDITAIIHGGAKGADSLAGEFAKNCIPPIQEIVFSVGPSEWKRHGKFAGPIRNQKMLDEGKPDLVVAFAGGRGTADMVRRAKAANVPVREIPE